MKKNHIEGVDMALSKLSPKRQLVVPEDVCKTLGAEAGDYIEFVKKESDIVIKAKKLVDARSLEQAPSRPLSWNDLKPTVPPVQTREDRLAMLKALQGDATDDSEDINLEFIESHRTSSDRKVEFD